MKLILVLSLLLNAFLLTGDREVTTWKARGHALPLLGTVLADSSEVFRRNTDFAIELHQYWASKNASPEWDLDWIIHYEATQEILSNQPPMFEVPDIRAKWLNWEYNK